MPASANSQPIQLIQALGQGSWGEVYLAESGTTRLAVKFLHPGLGPQALDIFKNEVRLLSRLSHPHLVRIFDFFPAPRSRQIRGPGAGKSLDAKLNGRPCFTMEYLEGVSLEDCPPSGNTDEILDRFVQLAQGLHYLHSRNVLHRDLKPSNIQVLPSGQIKILDFNLSAGGTQAKGNSVALGTPAFMAPEALRGEYSIAGDLFSWGMVFYRWLCGETKGNRPLHSWRPDLPEFFCRMVDRLLEKHPDARPSSAAAVLKYLDQHLGKPIPVLTEAAQEIVLDRIPLVGRKQIMEEVEKIRLQARDHPSLLHLTGPLGVGRSRLIEELKWRFQLGGVEFLQVSGPFSSKPQKFLQEISNHFRSADSWVLAFSDLQDWASKDLQELKFFLHLARLQLAAGLILLESRAEVEALELNDLPLHTIALTDLSPSEALDLLHQGFPEANPKRLQDLAEASGGRPLLLIEGLRQEMLGADRPIAGGWPALAQAQLGGLSEAGQRLFALLLSHPDDIGPAEIESLAEVDSIPWEDGILELDGQGLLAPRTPGTPNLRLSHPALKPEFYRALTEEQRGVAHRSWIHYLSRRDSPQKEGETAVLLAHHAWTLTAEPEVLHWGWKAAEFLHQTLQLPQAVAWLERLLPLSKQVEDKIKVNARLAPLYFNLGKYAECLEAYERWITYRPEEQGGLQRLKYLYYTGFAFFNWGRFAEARERILQAIQLGNPEKYPAHRPYLSRAHSTLALLWEKEGQMEEARDQLEAALPLSGEDQLLQGEIEQCWGSLEQKALRYDAALVHFERAREAYRRGKNPPAEAQALHSAGQALQEAGDLARAEAALRLSCQMAQEGGDLLQWARFTENLALLHLDQARYGEAKQAMGKAGEILPILAKPEDLRLVELHRAMLGILTGNWGKSHRILDELEQGTPEASPDFFILLKLWRAEWAYLRGEEDEAISLFQALAEDTTGAINPWVRVRGQIGVLRCAFRWQAPKARKAMLARYLPKLHSLPFPGFKAWVELFDFLLQDPQTWVASQAPAKIQRLLQEGSTPEFRIEALRLLAGEAKRCGLADAALYFIQTQALELRKIYQNLTEEDQMDFENNRELKKLDRILKEALVPAPEPVSPLHPSPPAPADKTSISEMRFRQYSQINRYISQNRSLEDILERVMDAAIELTGAERGFLLLKDAAAKSGPLKGFKVQTARRLNQGSLAQKEFQVSLSAVKQVVEQGAYLLTDNAQLDQRLQTQQSVVLYQLKSILAVPLEAENQIIGAIYLDHPYRDACFTSENIVLLTGLADQAALAIQKAQMLAELGRNQEKLQNRIEDQAEKIETMSEQLSLVRSSLRYDYGAMIGQSPAMMKVFDLLDHVTETAIPVWIWGESGTGKELVARSLHQNSPRKKGPFVAENCGAIPETLLESELFGHKRGAFTHADRDRVGLLEQASGGTLFLDEVADMSLAMQAKLLRVLQEGEVRPLGATRTVKVDIRLVTASNRDLKILVQEGKFRQDLFFRINGLTIRLPPLRERKEDILLLAQHLIRNFSKNLNLKPAELSETALQLLLRHPWPGNIRELEGVLRTALLFAKGRSIQPEHLQLDLAPVASLPPERSGPRNSRSQQEEDSQERQMILEALRKCKLDKAAAAKKLGMGLRTLYTRMGILGLPKKKTLLAKYLGLN